MALLVHSQGIGSVILTYCHAVSNRSFVSMLYDNLNWDSGTASVGMLV